MKGADGSGNSSSDVSPPPVSKKKAGRRSQWPSDVLDDFIDIIVNDEIYQKKLVFANTKNQQNIIIYEKILKELAMRCKTGKVSFTVV